MKNITSSWAGQICGSAIDLQKFTGSDGVAVRRLSVAYFGGSVSVPLDETQFAALSDVDFSEGVDCRLFVSLVVKNGQARLHVVDYFLEGQEGWRPLTSAEKMRGAYVAGYGVITRRDSYTSKAGAIVCSVEVKTFGGPLTLSVLPEQYDKIPETGFVKIVCHVEDALRFVDGKRSSVTVYCLESCEQYTPKQDKPEKVEK